MRTKNLLERAIATSVAVVFLLLCAGMGIAVAQEAPYEVPVLGMGQEYGNDPENLVDPQAEVDRLNELEEGVGLNAHMDEVEEWLDEVEEWQPPWQPPDLNGEIVPLENYYPEDNNGDGVDDNTYFLEPYPVDFDVDAEKIIIM